MLSKIPKKAVGKNCIGEKETGHSSLFARYDYNVHRTWHWQYGVHTILMDTLFGSIKTAPYNGIYESHFTISFNSSLWEQFLTEDKIISGNLKLWYT